ncbi:hypothetical protein RND81_12G006200 [Saponaria officinalis]|uniref:Leucine-rich repeat-containing N-terminal plant-type domain-containing protein n=1 Tax=Saponaria officinalis TaxID=3572 RepID=A0AAW1H1N4_SAPOF
MNKLKTLPFLSLSLILLQSSLSAELCHPNDKKTLFQIKKSFNNAYEFASWTPDTDCCTDWYLVKCDETTNRVTSLTVSDDNEVTGSIPEIVGNLQYLEYISFQNLPKLTGTLPKTLVNLKYLKSLWITKTNLSGQVPPFLGQIPKLNYINLRYNNLSGQIPASLSNLRELGYLALDGNHLTGPIPPSFGLFSKNQDFYLRLSRNKLTGPIPKTLQGIDFTELDLSRNQLSGDASIFFGKTKKSQRVYLSRNQFSFDLTKVEFSKTLNIIDLSHNMIYGSLPPTLAKIPYLQQLDVSYNKLCGKIPTGGELKRFDKSSYVHNKCLCGTPLPKCK